MVMPVPTVLHAKDVKTLPADVFDRVESLGSPRLVGYWEQDPCPPDVNIYGGVLGNEGGGMSGGFGYGGGGQGGGGTVPIEWKFSWPQVSISGRLRTDPPGS